MKKVLSCLLFSCSLLLSLSACGERQDLVDMESVIIDDIGRGVIWESRTYAPFCVVSKSDCGKQIGYVDCDTTDRISEYKGY